MLLTENFTLIYNNNNFKFNVTIIDDPDYFNEGFESPWLVSSLVIAYTLNCIACGGLSFIVWFEITGRAGPYRTLINKLVCLLIQQVSIVNTVHT